MLLVLVLVWSFSQDIEIPVKVIIEMEHSTTVHEILARYQTHIRDNYKEPTDLKFDDWTSGNFEELSGRGQLGQRE